MATEFELSELYNYQTKNGVVLPITNNVRGVLEESFKTIFDKQDLSFEPSTPQGRLVEALTLLFCDVLRVCAINANGFNPSQAVGSYLDNLGTMYGIVRSEGESDSSFRKRIMESNSNGSSYAAALRSALSRISGVTSVSVLDNGNEDPASLPSDAPDGVRVSVDPHSVLICIGGAPQVEEDDGGYNTNAVLEAIFNNISAGCGMLQSSITNVNSKVEEPFDKDGVSKTIVFYKKTNVEVTVSVSVRDTMYTGYNIIKDTTNAIKDFIRGDITSRSISEEDIASAIASAGSGIVCSRVELKANNNAVEVLNISPLQAISLADDAITVEVL